MSNSKKLSAKDDWERVCKLSPDELREEYWNKAEETWDKTWEIHHDTEGWKPETGKDFETGVVVSKTYPKMGKVYKLQGYVDANPHAVFDQLVVRMTETHLWNPTIVEGKVLMVINDSADIAYSVSAAVAGGLVSSRDFVNLRHWKTRDGVMLSAAVAISHPDAPVTKKHVRGESRAGGWIFQQAGNNPNKCLFSWVANTDLKGWLPHYVVDHAMSSSLMDVLKHIRIQMANVAKG